MALTLEQLKDWVRVATQSGAWTEYAVWDTDMRKPSPGKKGVKAPFPSENFKLTTHRHQEEVKRIVEAADYDFYVPD